MPCILDRGGNLEPTIVSYSYDELEGLKMSRVILRIEKDGTLVSIECVLIGVEANIPNLALGIGSETYPMRKI